MEGYGKSSSPWMSYCYAGAGEDQGFSWPPRSYTCSFCKREFRSAQALGGHMNVHRRDKARLRHCSPPVLTNPNPNLVPNLNMPPPPAGDEDQRIIRPVISYSFPFMLSPDHLIPFSSSSSRSTTHDDDNTKNRSTGEMMVTKPLMFDQVDHQELGIAKLNLEIGAFDDQDEENQNLDLELRLGCS